MIKAFGLKEITGKVSSPSIKSLEKLFPKYDCEKLIRQGTAVNILIGCDNFGLHPKREVFTAGRDLSIMGGKLGICLQGTHEQLKEKPKLSSNCIKKKDSLYAFF